MLTIEFLAPEESKYLLQEIIGVLTSNGFNCIFSSRESKLNSNAALLVAITKPADPFIFSAIGHRIGKGLPLLLLINDNYQVPNIFSAANCINVTEGRLIDRVVIAVKELLSISTPSHNQLKNLDQYFEWLNEDWSRLKSLDVKSFEHLILLVLNESGFKSTMHSNYGDTTIEVREPNWNLSWLVDCHTSYLNRPLGLKQVRECHALCSAKNMDFIFLFANSNFTEAAAEWASRCVPAIHLVDIDHIKNSLITLFSDLKHVNQRLPHDSIVIDEKSFDNYSKLFKFDMFNPNHYSSKSYNIHHVINNEITKHYEIANYSENHLKLCVISSGEKQENEDLVNRFKKYLKPLGVTIRILNMNETKNINLWSRIIMESEHIIFIPELNEKNRKTRFQSRMLNLMSINCKRETIRHKQRYYILAQDNPINRLRLPSCLDDALLIDPFERDWIASIEKIFISLKKYLYKIKHKTEQSYSESAKSRAAE